MGTEFVLEMVTILEMVNKFNCTLKTVKMLNTRLPVFYHH